MMLDKKQFQAISLFEFKMGWKAAEKTHNINNALVQEPLMIVQSSSHSRNFAKEMRVLKMRSAVDGHQKLTTAKWENHPSWSSYNYVKSCRRIHH